MGQWWTIRGKKCKLHSKTRCGQSLHRLDCHTGSWMTPTTHRDRSRDSKGHLPGNEARTEIMLGNSHTHTSSTEDPRCYSDVT